MIDDTVPAAAAAAFAAIRRPLTLGELLDRVVTVIVRRYATWAAIFAAVLVPLGICQAFASNNLTRLLAQVAAAQTVLQHGRSSADTAASIAQLSAGPRFNVFDGLLFAVLFFLYPVAIGAAVVFASNLYDGRTLSLGEVFRIGTRRWLSQIGLALVWLVGVVMVVVVFAIVVGIVVGIAAVGARGAVGSPNPTALLAVVVPLVIVVVAIALAVGSIATVIYLVADCTVIMETANPFQATGRAFARIFRGREVWRALLAGFALLVITYLVTIIATVVGVLVAGLVHLTGVVYVFTTVAGIVAAALQFAFVTFYYRDVRLRRDGGDILTA
jgi:hypothetical protein